MITITTVTKYIHSIKPKNTLPSYDKKYYNQDLYKSTMPFTYSY